MSARPGPRPTPPELAMLEGGRKDRINHDAPKPPETSDPPKPPAGMSAAARKIWRRLAPDLHSRRLLTDWDLEAFEIYCEAVVLNRDARADLRADTKRCRACRVAANLEERRDGDPLFCPKHGGALPGVNTRGDRAGVVRNPAWAAYKDTATIVRNFASEFGLTPSARAGIRVDPPGTGQRGRASRLLS